MSPSPATSGSPLLPASYAWEATDEAVAARAGIPLERVVRLDLNTPPAAPDWLPALLASGSFQTALNEYPPGDYRALTEAAAAAYGVDPSSITVTAGADEALELCAKAFLPPGGRAVVPAPTYAMYRVVTEQRPAEVVAVPRLAREEWRLDLAAVRSAARSADLVWLCSPNNPTGAPEADGAIETLLDTIAADAFAGGRPAPVVVLDEAYGEFVGRERAVPLPDYPRLVVVRTVSKAYALAGLRVGFAIASPELAPRLAAVRPPGSVGTIGATAATEALLRPEGMRERVAAISAERDWLRPRLAELGWEAGPSVTNFLLVDFGSPARAHAAMEALLAEGLVPRSFGAGHRLADRLRLTVRDRAAHERLRAVARAFGPSRPTEAMPPQETTR